MCRRARGTHRCWPTTTFTISSARVGRHLHIDPFSGIAGDMFLGALVDLGLELDRLRHILSPLPIHTPFRIETTRVSRHGIAAVDLKVHTDHAGDPHTHHHTNYRDIVAMIDALSLRPVGRRRAHRVVTLLAEAEARVHGMDVERVHFHEVGAVDSIVDMLGSVAALDLLEIETLSCGPLPISRGFVTCEHGRLPLPAPATALLMRNVATVGVDREGELVTPTGAALVAGLCDHFGPPPPMTVRGVGYGAGDRDDPDVPNVLRVFLADTIAPGDLGPLTPNSHVTITT